MCCSKKRQQRLLQQQQEILQPELVSQPRQRGCCGSRRQKTAIHHGAIGQSGNFKFYCPCTTMAGILIVSLGIGAEKLGKKISEKRLERKDRKTLERHGFMYTPGESSSAATEADRKPVKDKVKDDDKKEEVFIEKERRDSVDSGHSTLLDEVPPRYEEVVGQARH